MRKTPKCSTTPHEWHLISLASCDNRTFCSDLYVLCLLLLEVQYKCSLANIIILDGAAVPVAL